MIHTVSIVLPNSWIFKKLIKKIIFILRMFWLICYLEKNEQLAVYFQLVVHWEQFCIGAQEPFNFSVINAKVRKTLIRLRQIPNQRFLIHIPLDSSQLYLSKVYFAKAWPYSIYILSTKQYFLYFHSHSEFFKCIVKMTQNNIYLSFISFQWSFIYINIGKIK